MQTRGMRWTVLAVFLAACGDDVPLTCADVEGGVEDAYEACAGEPIHRDPLGRLEGAENVCAYCDGAWADAAVDFECPDGTSLVGAMRDACADACVCDPQ